MRLYFLISIIAFISVSFNSRSKTMGKAKVIMAIFAHPDDELDVTPMLSKYAREGHEVFLVWATSGEKGIREHAKIPAGDSLAIKRREEGRCATEKININPPIFLKGKDGELANDFTGSKLSRQIDSIYKIYKPDIVITWGPDGGYGHPDHRMVHNIVTELFQSGLHPYPLSLYYSAIPSSFWKNKEVKFKTGFGNWLNANWKPVKDEFLTVRIKCTAEDSKNAEAALKCHWSQFTAEEIEDLQVWMRSMNKKDTVFLRPFLHHDKIKYSIVD